MEGFITTTCGSSFSVHTGIVNKHVYLAELLPDASKGLVNGSFIGYIALISLRIVELRRQGAAKSCAACAIKATAYPPAAKRRAKAAPLPGPTPTTTQTGFFIVRTFRLAPLQSKHFHMDERPRLR